MDFTEKNLEKEMHEIFPKNIQDYIQPRYSLVKEINKCKAVTVITALAKQVPNFKNKLHDLELLVLVCMSVHQKYEDSIHK